ncbi:MAG: GTPase HflX [Burkholderiales bacterium]|jgi:GTP-binding protein HflX|nr:GTPase HflX [Burkholderiales bacterium]
MFDRPHAGDKALLVRIDFGEGDMQSRLDELTELVTSAGVMVVGGISGRRLRPDAAFFAGSGKVEEIAAARKTLDANLVVFDHALTGIQQRNLEKTLECRVEDRIGLILDIFAQRARSAEGKLQVELAQLKHQVTRLVGGWTHLERQKGGIGLRGGMGEKQIEADRRIINRRIKHLNAQLDKLMRSRKTQSRTRMRARVRTVALVGYTNAGKSTLFNRLTHERLYAADQLFATLDTTLRRLPISDTQEIVLSDTVGFIRDLPHDLIVAFHATLSEAADADLLLHVIDASSPTRDEQIASVETVLREIGAEERPQLRIFNKLDKTDLVPGIERDGYGRIRTVRLSALTGDGCADLRAALTEYFPANAPDSHTNDAVTMYDASGSPMQTDVS